MKILAFDTCNAIASASIIIDETIVSNRIEIQSSKQAESLISIIDECLKEAKLTFSELDAIAVTNGPGSFTGVRIGLSAAKGFRLVTKLPLIDVSCLEALAYNFKDSNKKIVVAMDARRDQLYFQTFLFTNALTEVSLVTYEEAYNMIDFDNFIIVGEGAKFLESKLISIGKKFQRLELMLEASLVAKAAMIKYQNKSFQEEIEPLYIREVDAKKQF
ncbi:MAG: tRNA (adenosine(37)-N6)-threonylcarbamoyltransferase complex dimerization subunit type 1 TsaB [Alphaproteobacteria bacterium]